ncbi:MAG: hypothetical protein GF405_04995 [Candidatus Eisenbacteria bacterium]|nr:hypothetical protein [Candidatus Eisenbacteria bacterium]
MRPHAAIGIALLIIISLTARAGDATSITAELSSGIRASFKHRIIVEQETWPSALMETRAGRAMLKLERAGGFRLHVRIRENPDDYLICVIYVDGGAGLVLDETSRFALFYDGTCVESTEILLTDSPKEYEVWSTLQTPVVLTSESTLYAKVRSGGYLTAVRFPKGALPDGNDWVPDRFELRRGGERNEEADVEDLAGSPDRGDDAGCVPGGRES